MKRSTGTPGSAAEATEATEHAASRPVSAESALGNLFWPPADDLLDAYEAIRAKLAPPGRPGMEVTGTEPLRRVRPPWRVCLLAPEAPAARAAVGNRVEDPSRLHDVIVVASAAAKNPEEALAMAAGAVPERAQIDAWCAQGASVISLHGDLTLLFTDPNKVANESFIALLGARSDDWIAALAAFGAEGFALHDALCLALAWQSPGVDSGPTSAWPDRLDAFPKVVSGADASDWAGDAGGSECSAFPPCPFALGLYPVVPNANWVDKLVKLGVRTVQLRVKSDDGDQVQEEIARAVAAAAAAPDQVRLFINDHWRMAIDAGAYGVHLGQEDLSAMAASDLAAIAQAGVRLGLSTHGYFEILRALRYRPSYIACGAIFPTGTKQVATPPQGLGLLGAYVRLLGDQVPVVAIGGISLERLPSVVAQGARSAAVVSAVTGAGEGTVDAAADAAIKKAVATLQQAFNA